MPVKERTWLPPRGLHLHVYESIADLANTTLQPQDTLDRARTVGKLLPESPRFSTGFGRLWQARSPDAPGSVYGESRTKPSLRASLLRHFCHTHHFPAQKGTGKEIPVNCVRPSNHKIPSWGPRLLVVLSHATLLKVVDLTHLCTNDRSLILNLGWMN